MSQMLATEDEFTIDAPTARREEIKA